MSCSVRVCNPATTSDLFAKAAGCTKSTQRVGVLGSAPGLLCCTKSMRMASAVMSPVAPAAERLETSYAYLDYSLSSGFCSSAPACRRVKKVFENAEVNRRRLPYKL